MPGSCQALVAQPAGCVCTKILHGCQATADVNPVIQASVLSTECVFRYAGPALFFILTILIPFLILRDMLMLNIGFLKTVKCGWLGTPGTGSG